MFGPHCGGSTNRLPSASASKFNCGNVSDGGACNDAGPASLQAAPSDTLAQLDFEMDSDGYLFILPPIWGPNKNGVVGYGRFA